MKNLFCLFLLVSIYSAVKAQTTQEEFNYVTKGYSMQVESGLDMKKGYTLKDVGDYQLNFGKEGIRQTVFKFLYRTGQAKPCALMLIYKRTTGFIDYYCIPTPNASQALWQQTLTKIDSPENSPQFYKTFIWGLMKLTAELSAK
jgi:hypothetical protein